MAGAALPRPVPPPPRLTCVEENTVRQIKSKLIHLSNEAQLSLVCFGITEAREAINGDVQLARRFDVITLPRWKANDEFQQLVLAIIRNFPLRQPSMLTAGGLKRILRVTDGVTSKIFRTPERGRDRRDRERRGTDYR